MAILLSTFLAGSTRFSRKGNMYLAREADPACLFFSCKCLQTFDCRRVTLQPGSDTNSGSCKEALILLGGERDYES